MSSCHFSGILSLNDTICHVLIHLEELTAGDASVEIQHKRFYCEEGPLELDSIPAHVHI